MKFYTNAVLRKNGKIFSRGYDNGVPFEKKEAYSPTLYVSSKDDKSSDWTTIYGEPVSPVFFETVSEARDFMSEYREIDNCPIYGSTQYLYCYLSDEYPEETIAWDFNLIRVGFLDIEVDSGNGFPKPETADAEVTAITLLDKNTKISHVFGLHEFTSPFEGCQYHKCEDEEELLLRFVKLWREMKLDIVSGWNIRGYDIPYLVNRIKNVLGEVEAEKLSVWGLEEDVYEKFGKEQRAYTLHGISILDYYELYRKFTYVARESYGLDFISSVELGEKKLSFAPHKTLHDLYVKDHQRFMEYNARDAWLVYRLEKKLCLIELCATLAYDAKINYEDVYSQVKFWDTLICNHLKAKKQVVPQKNFQSKDAAFRGAYVKDPKVGKYKWVISFDATSLYPSLMLQYNVSPETMCDPKEDRKEFQVMEMGFIEPKFQREGYGLAANGTYFKNDKLGTFPELVQRFFTDRQKYKKKYLETKKLYEESKDEKYVEEMSRYNVYQKARKISLNSLYGAAGSGYFRFFSVRIAEAITVSGQEIVQIMESKVNDYLNRLMKNPTPKVYVIACDTDSLYITLDDLVQTVFPEYVDPVKIVNFLDKVCKEKLQQLLDQTCEEVAKKSNAFRNAVSFKREGISDAAFWTAKKRYAVRVWDSEGVRFKEPDVKVTGLEVVRSSTPGVVRKYLQEAIEVILDDNEEKLWELVIAKRKEFNAESVENISFPRSISNLDKYYDSENIYSKATPMQVRAALMYNHILKKKELSKIYRYINEGDKIKYLYLKQPNTIGSNTIGFLNDLPREFDLHKYADYDTMFNKTFIEPLTSILDCFGWTTERINKIDSLFD
jgi:DNA polymerase elongation subunit (family B)